MNILSLFGGIETGLIALKELGFKIDNYYSSEVDKYAISIAKYNFPEIQHLGSIEGYQEWVLPKIDMIIGGPPCQGFSFAGKQLNFEDSRSSLFFKFVEILWKYEPKYFLMENVKMKKEYSVAISELLEVDYVEINSALVSAQNRKRLYWCNWDVDQPANKGILLKDVIECGSNFLNQRPRGNNKGGLRENKSPSMSASSWTDNVHVVSGRVVGRNPDNPKSRVAGLPTKQMLEINQNPEKTNCLSTVQKNNVLVRTIDQKSKTARPGGNGSPPNSRQNWDSVNTYSGIRKLTTVECERLQTLPDNYTSLGISDKGKEVKISNTQRCRAIGNGWTKDVIKHILSYIR